MTEIHMAGGDGSYGVLPTVARVEAIFLRVASRCPSAVYTMLGKYRLTSAATSPGTFSQFFTADMNVDLYCQPVKLSMFMK